MVSHLRLVQATTSLADTANNSSHHNKAVVVTEVVRDLEGMADREEVVDTVVVDKEEAAVVMVVPQEVGAEDTAPREAEDMEDSKAEASEEVAMEWTGGALFFCF